MFNLILFLEYIISKRLIEIWETNVILKFATLRPLKYDLILYVCFKLMFLFSHFLLLLMIIKL